MIWLLVADGSKARLFDTNLQGEPFDEVQLFQNDDGGSVEQVDDRHSVAGSRLARRVADYLEDARRREAFDEIVVLAAPEFLVQLREDLTGALESAVRHEERVNLTMASRAELQSRFKTLEI